jgi:uncharacterized membrane protein
MEGKVIQIIIYAIGFIVNWIIIKKARGSNEEYNNWSDVFLTLLIAITSWIGFLILAFLFIGLIIIVKLSDAKPPKWL